MPATFRQRNGYWPLVENLSSRRVSRKLISNYTENIFIDASEYVPVKVSLIFDLEEIVCHALVSSVNRRFR